MSAGAPRPFPLVPQRRFAGVQFGAHRSPRRGEGDEVVGSRPYRPGDRTAWIDWRASARLSAARGSDEFVVREFFAEQAPRVALVVDRRPAMALYRPPLPWLDKRAAVAAIVRLVAASVVAEQGELAWIADDEWLPPRTGGHRAALERRLAAPVAAPEDALDRSLRLLLRHRALFPVGSFVFVVSDFLAPPEPRLWARLRALRWDVTPVVVQDPTWEQSFPALGGTVLPLADPATGERAEVWLGLREARARAAANRARLEAIEHGFLRLGFDPLVVGTSDPFEISRRFAAWAERRRRVRRRSA
jgi:uncharacterized protein (DUF58 family)